MKKCWTVEAERERERDEAPGNVIGPRMNQGILNIVGESVISHSPTHFEHRGNLRVYTPKCDALATANIS